MLQALAALAAEFDGVVSLEQASALGATRSQIHRWVERGRVERIGRHSVTFPGQPATWRRALRAALHAGGSSAVISHRSAAALHGFDGFAPGPVEMTVSRSRRNLVIDGAVVHSLAALARVDRTTVDGLLCTSATFTILDLAATCSSSSLENAVDSAIRSGASSAAFLAKRLANVRHRGRDGVRAVDRVLVDAGGTNRLERRFLQLCRQHGLARPATQVIHRRGDQTVARVDFDFTPHPLVVEVEGQIAHASPRQRQRDAQRRRELHSLGRTVYSYTFEDIFQRPAVVAAEIHRALASSSHVLSHTGATNRD